MKQQKILKIWIEIQLGPPNSWIQKQPSEVLLRKGGNFIKKETPTQVFSCEICKISKNTFLTEHLWPTPTASINKCLDM